MYERIRHYNQTAFPVRQNTRNHFDEKLVCVCVCVYIKHVFA